MPILPVARFDVRALKAKIARWVTVGMTAFLVGWMLKGALKKLVG